MFCAGWQGCMCQGPAAKIPLASERGRRPQWLECRGKKGSKGLCEATLRRLEGQFKGWVSIS